MKFTLPLVTEYYHMTSVTFKIYCVQFSQFSKDSSYLNFWLSKAFQRAFKDDDYLYKLIFDSNNEIHVLGTHAV